MLNVPGLLSRHCVEVLLVGCWSEEYVCLHLSYYSYYSQGLSNADFMLTANKNVDWLLKCVSFFRLNIKALEQDH